MKDVLSPGTEKKNVTMYQFSDLILDDTTAAVAVTEEKPKATVTKTVEYQVEIAEPDIVITKKTIKSDGTEIINGRFVLLITQGQFYVQNVVRGKEEAPFLLTSTCSDEFSAKAASFFNKLEKTGGRKKFDVGSVWLPVMYVDKKGIGKVCEFLLDERIRELIKKGYFKVQADAYVPYSIQDFSDDYILVLDEAVKIIGKEAVCNALTNTPRWMPPVQPQMETLLVMMKEINIRIGENEESKSSFMSELKKRYGVSGVQSFVQSFLSVINPYAIQKSYDIEWSIFYNVDGSERVFELKKFTEYLTYGPICQGFDTLESFINKWEDTLNLEMEVYGEIREKYPKHLTSLHDLLASKAVIIRREVDEEKFAEHAEAEKKFIWKPEGEKYFITSPETSADMLDEASQQANCLSSYVNAFANKITDIYFMRYQKAPEKSLVTIEVKNGKVRQAFRARNEKISEEESKFLARWCKKMGISCNTENFTPLVAPVA